MREPVRKILIIEPSVIIAEGIRHVIDNFSGFDVCGMLQYVSEEPEKQLGEYDADIVIVDMEAFDRSGRSAGRDTIRNILDVPVVALLSSAMDAGIAAGYDATIYLSDRSDEIEQKLTSTLKSVPNEAKAEGDTGMCGQRHAEQGDSGPFLHFHIYCDNSQKEHNEKNRHQDCGRPDSICTAEQPH